MLETPSYAVLNESLIKVHHAMQLLSMEGLPPIFVNQAIIGFSYKQTTLFIISAVKQEGWSHYNFLLHF